MLGIIAARNKPEAQLLEREISGWLASRNVAVRDEDTLARTGTAGVAVIVVLGGDGLMMRCARMFPNVPLLGINFGHVGFLTMVERSAWRPALEAVLAGDYRVQRGPTLAAQLVRAGQPDQEGWCINDAVIRAGPQMIEMELYIDGNYVNTYPGDGIIVATPQGSTAYCMAAGGPILARGVRGFAIVPLNPHSPIRIPLVVEEEALIELVITNEKPSWLYLDGNTHTAAPLARGDLVRVRRGEHTFALALLDSMSFYDAIRGRFNFLIRPQAIPSRARAPFGRDHG